MSEGSYVSSTTRIASLQDLEKVKIDFAVPERYAQVVKVGQSVQFTRAGSDQMYSGQIFAIEPKIDPQTRTLQVRAIAPNAGGRLLPGGFAEVTLELERFDAALLVPTQALIPELNGQKVFLAKRRKGRHRSPVAYRRPHRYPRADPRGRAGRRHGDHHGHAAARAGAPRTTHVRGVTAPMSLAETSIRRPVLAIVMSIAIILFGVIGYTYLGVREYPSVDASCRHRVRDVYRRECRCHRIPDHRTSRRDHQRHRRHPLA